MIRDFARARATESLIFHSIQLLEKPLPENHNPVMTPMLFRNFAFKYSNGGPLSTKERTIKEEDVATIGWISSMEDFIRKNMLADGVTENLFAFLLSYNPFIMIKRRNSSSLFIKNLFAFPDSYNPLVLTRPRPSLSLYKLTVLDLSNSGIEVAPRQISNLISLQYLNLSHTWIDRLPIELKALTKLKCLNLEHDDQLRMIPRKLISSLSSLRILKMFRCGFFVEEEARNMLSLRNMDINPILSLKHLKVLSITITSVSALHTYFRNFKLLDCTESLSLEVFWGSESLDITPLVFMKNLLTFEIHQAELLKEFICDYQVLISMRRFKRLREVAIEKCSSLEELTWVILVRNLTILRVKSCENIKEIISSERLRKYDAEPIGCSLTGTPSKEEVGGPSFDKLSKESLFIEKIESKNDAVKKLKLFEKLEILSLDSLPELSSIYETALPFECLKKMEITDCSLLKKLPLNSTITKANEVVIEAEEDWWNYTQWEDQASKACFLPCFKPLE